MMDHQRDLLDVPVADLGDTPAYGPTVDMVAGVTQRASDIVGAGKIPIVIGGEHSLAPAVVRAFPKDIGVLGIDAHLDFRDSYLNDSWSHACSARRIADHVGVEHIVYLGVRSYSRQEREDLERLGLTYVSVYDIHDRGMTWGAERALKAGQLRLREKGATSSGRSPGRIVPDPSPASGFPRPANPGRICPPEGGARAVVPELVPTRGIR